jgi:hypothetical protein
VARTSPRHPIRVALVAGVILVLSWGAFAFGAVYPWAYTPLVIASIAIGATGLLVTRAGRPPLRSVTYGLLATGLAISLQLVPLPGRLAGAVSPHLVEFEHQYERAFGVLHPLGVESAGGALPDPVRPLSILPSQTIKGLMLLTGIALLFLGTARVLSATGGLLLVRPIIVIGVVLALFGIGQDALTRNELSPPIYGFWQPQFRARGFGPFVNPNHFAGWMLMVLPLGLALAYEALQRPMEASEEAGPRVSVVHAAAFGRALTFGVSSVAMALALVMTRSRSGLAAFAVGCLIAGWIVLKRQRSLAARAVVALVVVALLGGTVAWAGLDAVMTKALGDRTGNSLGGRIGAWRDTTSIIHDFPLAGSGFNTYGRAMTIYQTGSRDVHFQEAHNDYLQLAAEGGFLVGLPVLFTVFTFVRDIRRRFQESPREGTTYWLRIGAVIGLLSIAMQSLLEFSLQMPGNAALFAVLAALAVHQSPNLPTQSSRRERGATSIAHAPS